MKLILNKFLVIVLSGLLTTFSLSGCSTSFEKEKVQKYDQRIIKQGKLGVEILTPIKKNEKVETLLVKEENFRDSQVLGWFFEYPNKVRKISEHKSRSGVNVTEYISDYEPGKYLYLSNLCIDYRDDSKLKNDYSFNSKEQALEMAKEFIEEHGGFPGDFEIKEITHLYLNSANQNMTSHYRITFMPKPINNIRFLDNEIRIVIGSKGVVEYFRLWRQPVKLDTQEERRIKTPDEILKELKDTDGTIKGFYDIQMELVYYGAPWDCKQTKMSPVWLIKNKRNNTLVEKLDAYTGVNYVPKGM